ncbi:conserved hypothetical protein [Burkholderia orbicola]
MSAGTSNLDKTTDQRALQKNMAKFRIYNIQLLPRSNEIDEVGVQGYRRLFSEFRDLNSSHLKQKTQAEFHYPLAGDSFLAPDKDFKFPAGYVSGNFVRYTTADELKELRSGKTLYRATRGQTAVSSQKELPFVFDTKRHFLAVDGAHLPKGDVFQQALIKFLTPVAEKRFPDHSLTVNLISRANALEDIFKKASGYRVVDVNLAFPNGPETERLLRELKETKTALSIRASGVGGDKGRMSAVPEFLKDVLRAAVTYGSARMTYFLPSPDGKKPGRWETYNSNDTPVTFSVRHSSKETEQREYFDRVAERLAAIDVHDGDDDDDQDGQDAQ